MGKYYLGDWTALWTEMPQDLEELHRTIRDLLDETIGEDPLSPITREQITIGLKQFKNNTALGIDHWSPRELKGLPTEAHEELATLLNDIKQNRSWPRHILYDIVVLMGKPNGGTRPIALMPMIYGLWTKIRKPLIAQWETTYSGPWDAAIKGSSALTAALRSQLLYEVAHYNKTPQWHDTIRHGKNYDNINN